MPTPSSASFNTGLDAGSAHSAQAMLRIQRMSRAMGWACLVVMVVLPCAYAWYWLTTSAPNLATQGNVPASAIGPTLTAVQRASAALVNAVPLGFLLIGLYNAKRCFDVFIGGEVFSAQAVKRLRGFAGWMAAAALAAMVATAITSVLLTLNNPKGTRILAVSFGSDQVLALLLAGMVWVMAAVIAEGQALAEENRHFV
jgi:Protein of unknown function (DUF2975)